MMSLFHFPFDAMGTACQLYLYAHRESEAETIAQLAIDEVLRIEQKYSRFRDDSFLSHINRAALEGQEIHLDDETAGLLDYAFACYRKSAGKFDISAGVLYEAWDFSADCLPSQDRIDALLPRVGMEKMNWQKPLLKFPVAGMRLDFGGIGKEYAADRTAELSIENGALHGLVDLGGDIRVFGGHPDGSPWRIGIRDPFHPENALAVLDVTDGAVASSGNYERYIEIAGKRYCHILNPQSGWPAQGLASVSVVAERCLVAGSVSTIAMLKGYDAIPWLEELRIACLWVDEEGKSGGSLTSALID